MEGFSIIDSIKFGWSTFNERRGVCLSVGAIILALSITWDWAYGYLHQVGNDGLSLAAFILGIVFSCLLSMGEIHFALRAHDLPHDVRVQDLWAPRHFWSFLGSGIAVGLFVLLGFLLLIIPGIVFALMVMFAAYVVVDEGRGPIASLKESARITKGHRLKLLGFVFAMIAFNALGLVMLVIGLTVTLPVSLIATAYVYRMLQQQSL